MNAKISKSLLLDHEIGMAIEAHRAKLGVSFVEWVSTDPRLSVSPDGVAAEVKPRKGVKLVPSKYLQDHSAFIREAVGTGRLPDDFRTGKRTVTYRSFAGAGTSAVLDLPSGLRPWANGYFLDDFEPVVLEETVWGWNVFTRDGHHKGLLVIHRDPPVEPIVWGFADTLPKTEESSQ